jgi:hypothetical protein
MNKAELRALADAAVKAVPVKKVPTGQTGLGELSDRDWAKIVRDPNKYGQSVSDREAERISERRMEVARDAANTGDRNFAAEVVGGFWDEVL